MKQELLTEIELKIDDCFPHDEMNAMMKRFAREKLREGSKWAEIATSVHDMLGGASPSIGNGAAAAELMLLALDIVDDLQDQDHVDKPWMAYPQSYVLNAVLSCIALFMGELGRMIGAHAAQGSHLLKQIGELLAGAVCGQQSDISGAVKTEADYMDVIQHKSGLLMQLACFLGYSLVEPRVDERTAEVLNEMAVCIGIVSQLQNDMSDIVRMDGKNDLLHRRKTLPILFLLKGSEAEFPLLSRYYEGDVTKEQFLSHKQAILDYIYDSGCMEYTRAIQNLYRERADALLDSIETAEEWKNKFREMTYAGKAKAVTK